MSDRQPALARMPSWADTTPPWPGSWCRACHGTRWWTERRDPKGWRCMTCHPPDHLPPEAIRRENEPKDAGPAAPRAPRHGAAQRTEPVRGAARVGIPDIITGVPAVRGMKLSHVTVGWIIRAASR